MVNYPKYLPKDLFVSYVGRKVTEEERWAGVTAEIIYNKKTGNEPFDLFVDLVRQKSWHHAHRYAKEMGVETNTMSLFVRMVSGISCEEWIQLYLHLCALDLLQHTDWPMKKIAKELGFSSEQNFGHEFTKRMNNCPPARWRRLHKE